MNYKKTKCQVCKKEFNDNDDIVVCPKCGAPYHRECYKAVGHCKFEEENGENAEFKYEPAALVDDEAKSKFKRCPVCREKTEESTAVCPKCGFIYNNDNIYDEEQEFYKNLEKLISPLGGFEKDEEVADGVNANDMANFVGTSVRYYMTSFKQIKDTGRSRFNISAFLFSGAWMLYRKQYKLGIIVLLITIILNALTQFSLIFLTYDVLKNIAVSISGNTNFNSLGDVLSIIISNSQKTGEVFSGLPFMSKIFMILPFIFNIMSWVVMIICGFKGNKIYMNFCCKKISKIKKSLKSHLRIETDRKISEAGGVNIPLGICLLICYIIISEFPKFI